MDFEVVLAEVHQEDVSKVDVRMRGEVEIVEHTVYRGVSNHDLVTIVIEGFHDYSDCVAICHSSLFYTTLRGKSSLFSANILWACILMPEDVNTGPRGLMMSSRDTRHRPIRSSISLRHLGRSFLFLVRILIFYLM